MTTEQNKKIVRRLFDEGMMQKKFQLVDELISEKFIHHGTPNPKPGPQGFLDVVQQFYAAFPDMKIDIQEIIGEGDTVATRGYFTGSHEGNFMNIPATGKKIRVEYIDFWKLSNGKCVENWVQMDLIGLMQQLKTTEHAF